MARRRTERVANKSKVAVACNPETPAPVFADQRVLARHRDIFFSLGQLPFFVAQATTKSPEVLHIRQQENAPHLRGDSLLLDPLNSLLW